MLKINLPSQLWSELAITVACHFVACHFVVVVDKCYVTSDKFFGMSDDVPKNKHPLDNQSIFAHKSIYSIKERIRYEMIRWDIFNQPPSLFEESNQNDIINLIPEKSCYILIFI